MGPRLCRCWRPSLCADSPRHERPRNQGPRCATTRALPRMKPGRRQTRERRPRSGWLRSRGDQPGPGRGRDRARMSLSWHRSASSPLFLNPLFSCHVSSREHTSAKIFNRNVMGPPRNVKINTVKEKKQKWYTWFSNTMPFSPPLPLSSRRFWLPPALNPLPSDSKFLLGHTVLFEGRGSYPTGTRRVPESGKETEIWMEKHHPHVHSPLTKM